MQTIPLALSHFLRLPLFLSHSSSLPIPYFCNPYSLSAPPPLSIYHISLLIYTSHSFDFSPLFCFSLACARLSLSLFLSITRSPSLSLSLSRLWYHSLVILLHAHCNTPATHCNILQHSATHSATSSKVSANISALILQHTATHAHRNTLHHTATLSRCNTPTHCITLQHTALPAVKSAPTSAP